MNRKEFDEMRFEFGEYVYNYEFFQKVGFVTDMYYTKYFKDDLKKIQRYEIENIVLEQAIALKNKNAKEEEILKYLADSKEKFIRDTNKYNEKIQKALQFIDHNEKMSSEDKNKFEQEYLEFCKNLHPVVKCKTTNEENNAYLLLRNFYFENNYSAFQEFTTLHKDGFPSVEYDESEFVNISKFYFENKTRINQDYSKKSKLYPYTKQDTLKDEISLARESGELHVSITNLMRQNKDLHQQFKKLFKDDYNITE